MAVINFGFPLFFHVPSIDFLKGHMNNFDLNTLQDIESKVRRSGLQEGVQIADWDKDWGKHHLYDSGARLVNALIEKKKEVLFEYLKSSRTTNLIASHCYLFFDNLFSQKIDPELLTRGGIVNLLEQLKNQWNTKYPRLRLCVDDEFDARSRAWKAKEISFLVYPIPMNPQMFAEFSNSFLSICEQLIQEGNEKAAEIVLDCLLRRESFHPNAEDLNCHSRLRSMNKMVLEKVFLSNGLHTASESLWKNVTVIPSQEDRQAKFKPLAECEGAREAYAYQCDRVLGFGMTAPTQFISTSGLGTFLSKIKSAFVLAHSEMGNWHTELAAKHRQRAFDLLNHPFFPADARNAIFGEMYRLYGKGQKIEILGEKLFYNYGGFSTTDREKATAIDHYLVSSVYNDHLRSSKLKGSLQLWKNDCSRVYEVIVKNPRGGELLKSAPKVLAHLYALLGIIKGSKDCSSGNTFAIVDSNTNSIVNFWDFDDERSMSASNQFWDLRMWQLGLPQCAEPFNRSTLLLFTDQNLLLKKLTRQQTSSQIPTEAYREQNSRLKSIIQLFQQELEKSQITLTPRELFFTLFRGREDFNRIKKAFNDNKSCGQEGIRISPIELFEFHLPETGRGHWYTSDENEKTLIGRNMRALYSPDLP